MSEVSIMREGAAQLAEAGFHLVKLHFGIFSGQAADGSLICNCSCGKRGCKDSAAKHPIDGNWGRGATKDPKIVSGWYDDGKPWSIGLVLGPCFSIPPNEAVCDVENDTPEGLVLADELLKDRPTLQYTSGKGIHRIYRYVEGLPPVASVKVRGLEFRMGGPGLQTQSVCPPSRHRTGVRYEWLGAGLDGLQGGVKGLNTLK